MHDCNKIKMTSKTRYMRVDDMITKQKHNKAQFDDHWYKQDWQFNRTITLIGLNFYAAPEAAAETNKW